MSTSDSNEAPSEVTHGLPDSEPFDSVWKAQLRSGQIRLFKIELDDGDSISGALEVFGIESVPEYMAQSYVCGEGECNFKITVNGNFHYIKPNLSIALRQTKSALQRCHSRGCGHCLAKFCVKPTWLWIDAICIDQSNPTELETQIQFMEHIYRGASVTCVSLGEWLWSQWLLTLLFEWSDAEAWISVLQKQKDGVSTGQAQLIDSARSRQQTWELRLQKDFEVSREAIRAIHHYVENDLAGRSVDVDPSSDVPDHLPLFRQASIELFESDWFKRLWTYQELVLSLNLFVTLPVCVPWTTLQLWRNTLVGTNGVLTTNLDLDSRRYQATLGNVNHRRDNIGALFVERENIWSLLVITAQRRTKVAKDHVFAILGLMHSDQQKLIEVNYSNTDAQVFQNILEIAIKTSTAYNGLPGLWENFASVPHITPGLPSWVPDLNNETSAHVGQRACKLEISSAAWSHFDDTVPFRFSPEKELILSNVLEVDAISTQSDGPCALFWEANAPPQPNFEQSFDEVLIWIKCLLDIMSRFWDNPPAVEMRLRNLFATVAGLRNEQLVYLILLIGASRLAMAHLSFKTLILHVIQPLRCTSELRQEILETLNADADHEALTIMKSMRSVADVLRLHFRGTHVFATAGGRVGYSPKSVSHGDRICIVPGGQLLHIFSASPSRYVTSAVVDGLMDESLLDVMREPGREWEEIVIH